MDYSTCSNMELIAQLIVEEAKLKNRVDRVADIYATMREVNLELGRIMRGIREEEK